MSILSEVNALIEGLDLPVETGVFKSKAPPTYTVVTPIADTFDLWADNLPQYDVQEVRISLFCQDNYLETRNALVKALLDNDFTITERRYIGHEDDSGYHHFSIDVEKQYNTAL
ncbi:hypothetical protein LJC74_05885 [Eubacteriales bacterium OttesenSCG-928-A19]|nr:hypothetical protein [Eubacteriales bacterium OttesenSCG-928-A19]